MKLKFVKYLAAMVVASIVIAIFAGTAAANSSAYTFTMALRYVSGKDNKTFHTLDAGELTLGGKIWITDKRPDADSTPMPISITVIKAGLLGPEVCTVTVTPDTILNSPRAYSQLCGHIEGGMYWLRISKRQARSRDGDGWHSQALEC